MDRSGLERTRVVSEALFGAKHRLPLAAAVADSPEDDLYAARLAPRVETTETQAGTELRRLHAAGLLEVLAEASASGQRGRPPRRYRRRDSSFWELARRLADEANRS